MPELPEVEVVRQQIAKSLPKNAVLTQVVFRRPDLRFPIPTSMILGLLGERMRRVDRRSKYLLFHFEKGGILSHLGMSGYWRFRQAGEEFQKHDHVVLQFNDRIEMIYNDPRRFGILDFFIDPKEHPLLKNLGIEAPDVMNFLEPLQATLKQKSVSAKNAFLDQRIIAGLGNIYVNEILHQAGVSPFRKAARIKPLELRRIAELTAPMLAKAVLLGGSSLKDFKHLDSASGGFQNQFQVYDRAGKNCLNCTHPIKQAIKHRMQNGRSTYWCSVCQK